MVNFAHQQSSRSIQGPTSGDLWLRIVGTARAGQIVRLSAPKCTIGSADGCTLRLRAAGVRGVQCLILRGTRGTVARSYASGTRLNGHAFGDAPLVVGDRLKVGPIEMEVLASDDPDAQFESRPADASDTPTGEPLRRATDRRRHEQASVARGRVRKLVEALRQFRAELVELRDHGTAAAQNELDRQRLSDNHERMLMAFRHERQQWEASCEAIEHELGARKRELDAATIELDAARRSLDQQQRERAEDDARVRGQWKEQSDALARAQQELQAAREALEQDRQAWRSQADNAQAELLVVRAELAEVRQRQARQGQDVDEAQQLAQAQLAERLGQFEAEQREWTAKKQDEESRLVLAQSQAAAEESRLCQQRERLDAERRDALAQREQADNQLAAARRSIEQQRAELERQAAETAARNAACETRLAELQTQADDLQRARAELDQARVELADARGDKARLAQERQAWETARSAAQEQLDRRAAELAERERKLAADAAAMAAGEQQRLLELSERIQDQRTELEARVTELSRDEQAWNELQAQQESQYSQRMQLVEERTAHVRDLQAALDVDREAFSQKRDQEEAGLVERAEELRVLTDELQDKRVQFASKQRSWRAEQEQAEQALADRVAELESRERAMAEEQRVAATDEPTDGANARKSKKKRNDQQAELEEARREIQMQHEKLSEERREAAGRYAEQQSELERMRQELADEQAAFRAERAAWEQQRSQADSDADEADGQESPDEEQACDVIVEEDQSIETAEVDSQPDDVEPPRPTRRKRPESSEPPADEDESIDKYMAALLDRMRGGVPEPAKPAPTPRRNKRKSDSTASIKPGKAEAAQRDVTSQPVVDMGPGTIAIPRRAPAETTDLTAMRELANTQAKLAIDTHGKKQLLKSVFVTSSAAVGCLVVTMLVLEIVSADHTAIRTATMAGFVGAIFWLFAAGTAIQQLIAARRSQQSELRENIERAERRKSGEPTESA